MKHLLSAFIVIMAVTGCAATSQQAATPRPCPCCEKMANPDDLDYLKMDHSKMDCCKKSQCPMAHEAGSHGPAKGR